MSVLSPASKKAIANLRAFTAAPTNYYRCPLARRAAVLILLIADRKGDLRVVLTIRSAGLKNYAGQAALPGGKSDALSETPFQTARREAFEEIGLPTSDHALPPGYTVEHLTELPTNLAMTELAVRPCVAYLRAPSAPPPPSPSTSSSSPSSSSGEKKNPTPRWPPDATRDVLPTLDAREVAAVFTAPFRNFLFAQDLDPSTRERVPGEWYRGSWHSWHETAWRMHQFFVPVGPGEAVLASRGPREYTAARGGGEVQEEKKDGEGEKRRDGGGERPAAAAAGRNGEKNSGLQPPLPGSFYSAGDAADPLRQPRYRVFGMTARILVDCARVAYGHEPEYEHNSHFGDEDMIRRLIRIGRLSSVRTQGDVLTRDVMIEAARAKM